jgi:hypothetical protein
MADMSFGTPGMVVSGKPYLVVLVSGRAPSSLADAAEADDFTIDMEGTPYRVHGSGRLVDTEVRYHEKDVANSGKDIRVWTVIRHEDGSLFAHHAAAF